MEEQYLAERGIRLMRDSFPSEHDYPCLVFGRLPGQCDEDPVEVAYYLDPKIAVLPDEEIDPGKIEKSIAEIEEMILSERDNPNISHSSLIPIFVIDSRSNAPNNR